MLIVSNSTQEVIAKMRIKPGFLLSRTLVATSGEIGPIFRALRDIPQHLFEVEINYPKVNHVFHLFNKGNFMDIENIVENYEARNKRMKVIEPSKTLFVAPAPDEVPNDGVLAYTTIESIFDIRDVPDRTVMLMRPDQLGILQCISENTPVFDVQLATLTGLPGASYTVTFDEATWAFDKVAYAPFISELRVAGEIEEQLAAQKRTIHDEEKAKYTRKTGEVKEHSNFKLAKIGSDNIDDDLGDDDDMRL